MWAAQTRNQCSQMVREGGEAVEEEEKEEVEEGGGVEEGRWNAGVQQLTRVGLSPPELHGPLGGVEVRLMWEWNQQQRQLMCESSRATAKGEGGVLRTAG